MLLLRLRTGSVLDPAPSTNLGLLKRDSVLLHGQCNAHKEPTCCWKSISAVGRHRVRIPATHPITAWREKGQNGREW